MPPTARSASPAKKAKAKKSARKGKKSARKKTTSSEAGVSGSSFNPDLLVGERLNIVLPKDSEEIIFGVAMNSSPESGVVVTGLTPGGLCDRFGIMVGDNVISVNRQRVLYAIETTELLRSASVGTIELELVRNDPEDEEEVPTADEEAPAAGEGSTAEGSTVEDHAAGGAAHC